MTDPIDHSARMKEIEARLDVIAHSEPVGDSPPAALLALARPADLRYLLDRVRALSERIEALEGKAGGYKEVIKALVFDLYEYSQECPMCDAGGDDEHDARCMLITHGILLPAPETVETQG